MYSVSKSVSGNRNERSEEAMSQEGGREGGRERGEESGGQQRVGTSIHPSIRLAHDLYQIRRWQILLKRNKWRRERVQTLS